MMSLSMGATVQNKHWHKTRSIEITVCNSLAMYLAWQQKLATRHLSSRHSNQPHFRNNRIRWRRMREMVFATIAWMRWNVGVIVDLSATTTALLCTPPV